MLASLRAAGYEKPTAVQAGMIPRALQGKDVLAQARTGTGKTAAFLIPILECLQQAARGAGPQALVLTPTRELAVQVAAEAEKLAHGRRTRLVTLYGGKPIRGQIEKLQAHPAIVVGTPGRILDHMARKTLVLSSLRFVVLDEADRMLDIGFRPDIEQILRRCPAERQTLLLSATLPPPIERLAQRYMREPESLNFSANDIAVHTIEQHYFTVDQRRKFELLQRLMARDQPTQAIIFCRTKRGTDRVYTQLAKKMPDVGAMHGDMSQPDRDRVMERFRQGKVKVLVATDVVGRGIDVSGVSHIINFDIPEFCDDYVHRVGRTGRMGRTGVAYTFVTPEEGHELTRIEMRIDRQLTRAQMDGFDAHESASQATSGAPRATENGSPEPSAAAAASDTPTPPPPPFGRGGRGPKRYRRAL